MAAGSGTLTRARLLSLSVSARQWVLLVLAAGVPLFFLRHTNDPFEVPKLGLLIAGVALAAALRVVSWLQGESPEGLRRLLVPASLVVVPLAVAWAVGSYRYWSLFGEYRRFQGLIPYVFVVLFGVLVADTFGDRLQELAFAFVVGGGVAGAYAVIQFVGIDPFEWGTVVGGETTRTSTLGNPNFTGGYLAITLPVALGLWRAGGERAQLALRAAVVILVGQALSFSQGGYAATAAGLGIFAAVVMRPSWRPARALGILTAVVAMAALLGLVGVAMVRPDTGLLPTTVQQRGVWWESAFQMAADRPIFGAGPNAFAVDGIRYRPVEDSIESGIDFANDVHSVPLSFLTSAGVLGLLGFLGVFVWAGRRILRLEPEDAVAAGFAGAVVAYLTQSLVSIDQVSLRVACWSALGALAASSVAIAQKARPKRRAEAVRQPVLVAVAGLAAVAVMAWSFLFIWHDGRVRQGTIAFLSKQPEDGLSLYERAIGFRNEYEYRHYAGVYLGATAEQTDSGDDRWISEMHDAFSYLEGFPSIYGLRDYAAGLYKLEPDHPDLGGPAADTYLQALDLDPWNSTLLSEAAPVLVAEDRDDELIELLAPRIERLQDREPSLWAYLALAYEHVGRHDDAVAALEKAKELAPATGPLAQAQEEIE